MNKGAQVIAKHKPAINPPNRPRRTKRRFTGIPKGLRVMAENSSPAPEFETDEDRTYFLIRLPINAGVTRQAGTKSALSRHQVPGEVTGEVYKLLTVLEKRPLTRMEAQSALALKGQANFRDRYLGPALKAGLIEMTIPDKPRSSKQKYQLTTAGRAMVAQMKDQRQVGS